MQTSIEMTSVVENHGVVIDDYLGQLLAEESIVDERKPGAVESCAAEQKIIDPSEQPLSEDNLRFLRHFEKAQRKATKSGDQKNAAASSPFVGGYKYIPPWGRAENIAVLPITIASMRVVLPVQFVSAVVPFDKSKICLEQGFEKGEMERCVIGETRGSKNAQRDGIRVLDGARLILPERYDSEMVNAYRYTVFINGSKWAIACDDVQPTDSLRSAYIRWRDENTRRSWLAGSCSQKRCAILDVELIERNFLADDVLKFDED